MVKIPRSIKVGLDTEHFDIIRVMSLGHFYPVIVMRINVLKQETSGAFSTEAAAIISKTLRDMTSYCTERQWQNPLSS